MDTNLERLSITVDSESESLVIARAIIKAAADEGIDARLMGGLAIWERCPSARKHPFGTSVRSGDIDLVVGSRHRRKFEKILCNVFDFFIDTWLATIPGEIHARFCLANGRRICDVTYDRIVYCHPIDVRARLTADSQQTTIPLAELLLTKLQIVFPSPKDLLDAMAIVADHDFGSSDGDVINLPIICRRCASDWALEYTVHMSTCRICLAILDMSTIPTAIRIQVVSRFVALLNNLHLDIKPIMWRLRAFRGRGEKWYSEPKSYPDPRPDELQKIT